MNVRIPKQNKELSDQSWIRKAIEKELNEECTKARADERETTTRRLIKLMCVVLHDDRFGFGIQRCSEVALGIIDLIEQGLDYWEGDVKDFWYKIDEELKFMGPDFYPSEDDIYRTKEKEN